MADFWGAGNFVSLLNTFSDFAWWIYNHQPFGRAGRLHWTGLTALFILGGFAFFANRKSLAPQGFGSLVGYLVPAKIYFSRSSLVDVKIYIANRFVSPFVKGASEVVKLSLVVLVAGAVGQVVHPDGSAELGWHILAVATVIAIVANDFAYYVVHRVSHESPLFWPFHRVHHSAEHLTPLTASRNHPVFDLALGLFSAACRSPFIGVVYGLFGIWDFYTLFGLNVIIVFFNASGGALRHSHIWLDYGPVVDRILVSPAMHQIHHSRAPRHHDKNYGLIFSIWDRLFGTIYIPKGREDLEFGIADSDGTPLPQPHSTLREAYLEPFAAVWSARRAQSTPTPANATPATGDVPA